MNVRAEYEYRDGGGTVFLRDVVVRASTGTLQAMTRSITAACEDIGTHHPVFIPRQVGLPEPYSWVEGPHIRAKDMRRFPIWPDIDHCWAGFTGLERTTAKHTDARTLTELVEAFESAGAAGWEIFDPYSEFPELYLGFSADDPPTKAAARRVRQLFGRLASPRM